MFEKFFKLGCLYQHTVIAGSRKNAPRKTAPNEVFVSFFFSLIFVFMETFFCK